MGSVTTNGSISLWWRLAVSASRLRPALTLPGFAHELRDLMLRPVKAE